MNLDQMIAARVAAEALAEDFRLHMRAIRSPAGGWIRDFGISANDAIYTLPDAFSVTGVYPMPSDVWQPVTEADLQGFMAAVTATPKGVFGVAGRKILEIALQADTLIKDGEQRRQQHQQELENYANTQSRYANAPAIANTDIRCGTLYTDFLGKTWLAVTAQGELVEFVPLDNPDAPPVTLGKLRGSITQPD